MKPRACRASGRISSTTDLLANGHILIADENNKRAIEVDRHKNIVPPILTIGGTANGASAGGSFARREREGA
jgi:hypothetical protein